MSIGYCRSRTPTTAACKNVNFTLASHVLCYVKCYVKFRPRAAGAVKLTPRVKLTRVNVKLKLRNLASHRTLILLITKRVLVRVLYCTVLYFSIIVLCTFPIYSM